ncbi:uncharacterized protein METZ01_LOCUS427896, partial [marine metagenome]
LKPSWPSRWMLCWHESLCSKENHSRPT